MASVMTQNIGAASAQTVPTSASAVSAQRAAAHNPTAQQVAQVTAVAADKATISLKTKDQNRSAKVAKRAEGVFSSQDEKPDARYAQDAKVSRRREKGSLDVEA